MEQKILAYLKEHETEIFEDLKSLVLTEASTSDIEALAKVREKLTASVHCILPVVVLRLVSVDLRGNQ